MTTKPTKKEAHVFWIDLEDFRPGYAIWKVVPPRERGRKTPPPVVCIGRINEDVDFIDGDVEFEFAVEDLEAAFTELAARKKKKSLSFSLERPYGDGVEIGGTGITLWREDRKMYIAYAPCGEDVVFTGAELRLLVAAVRDLQVSVLP